MDKKTIITQIKEFFSSTEEKFEKDYKTVDGRIIRCYGEGLEVGEEVKEITEEGEMALEDANYELEDGLVISIVEGKISEIQEVTAPEEMEESLEQETTIEMAEVETELTDGTKVKVTTVAEDGTLAIGDKVEVMDEEGNWVNAPEGKHETVDGLIIYVDAEGLINEIETPATEEVTEEMEEVVEEVNDEMFNSINLILEEVKSLREELNSIKEENTELKSRVETFAKAPSDEPLKKTPDFNKLNKEERLKFFGKK